MPIYCLLFLVFAFISIPSNAADNKVANLNFQGIPLVFEPNPEQHNDQRNNDNTGSRFLVHQPGLAAAFSPTAIDLRLAADKTQSSWLRLNLRGRSDVSLNGEQELAGKTNYLRGNDPAKWQTGITNFSRIRYSQLYTGIDLIFYGNGNQLEHDFVVSPGADPKQIGFDLSGARRTQLASNGDLLIHVEGGVLTFKKPQAYQESESGRKNVPVKFAMHNSRIGFELGRYDTARALVIDPVLSFATYLGGRVNESINSVALDSLGNIYVTGSTLSADFPIASAIQPICGGCSDYAVRRDAFVSKLDPSGHTLIYSTFLGGAQEDIGSSIAIDASGNAIVAGNTMSNDFPTLHPISTAPCCDSNPLFLTSLSPDGAHFNYSGVIGQLTPNEFNVAATVDSAGNTYVTGQTSSSTFPITPGTLVSSVPGYPKQSLFVTKVSRAGALVYSTIVPSTAPQTNDASTNRFAPSSIAVDSAGNAYVVGAGGNGLPTTPGVLSTTFPGEIPDIPVAFALKLNPKASALSYATYIPGTSTAAAVALDASGNAFIAGDTSSKALPVSANAFQKAIVAGKGCVCNSGYLLKLDPLGARALFATYFSGTPDNTNAGTDINAIALDNNSNIYVAGSTASADLPLKNPVQSNASHIQYPGIAFVSKFNSDASALLFSSFLGGSNGSVANGIAVDVAGKLVVAGVTQDVDFPTTANAFQPKSSLLSSNAHGFIAKIDVAAPAASICMSQWSIPFGSTLVNAKASKSLTLSNCGNADLHITGVVSSSPVVSATHTCSSPVIPGGVCTIDVTFTPTDTTFYDGKVTITSDAGISAQPISFSGKGGLPRFEFIPPLLEFSDVFVGTKSGEIAFALTNVGDGALIVSNIVASGDFAVSNNCSAPVQPANSCLVIVTHTPTAAGPRTGTLAIADNVVGSPHIIQLSGNGITQYPVPAITSIRAIPISGNGRFIVTGQNFFPNTTVFWNGTARQTFYDSSDSLLVQLNPADLTQLGEFPVKVSTGGPGGGVSNSVLATLFSQLKSGSVIQSVNEVVYEPHSQLIYATVPTSAATNVNNILVIDPALGTIVKTFSIGGSPNKLALSDDGQFLYVGLDAENSVAQLSLPSGTVNLKASLGSDPALGSCVADAIRVLPKQPHAYAVALKPTTISPGYRGVTVFDDSTPRPTAVQNSNIYPSTLLFLNGDASTLYSSDTEVGHNAFYRFNIGALGITLKDATQYLAGTEIDTDGKLIYLANGNIINPVSLMKPPGFNVPANTFSTAIKVDSAASRVLFGSNSNILVYDINTHAALGSVEFFLGGISRVLRWGTNGLAIKSSSSLYFLRSGVTGTSATATPASVMKVSATSLTFANTWVGRSSPSQAVQLSNAGPDTVALSNISVTGDFRQTNNCGASLAAGAVCSINVSFLPTSTGLRSGNLTINANGGVTTVSLSGQGMDVSIAIARASRSQRSTTPAAYLATQIKREVSITSVGLAGQVGLACTARPGTTCEISPSSFTATSAGSAPQMASVTVRQSHRSERIKISEPSTGSVTILVDVGGQVRPFTIPNF